MKVSDLIELLKNYPNQEAEVLVIEGNGWQDEANNKGYALKADKLWGDSGDMDMLIIE